MIVIQNLQLLYLLLIITTNIPFFGSSFVTTQHSTRRTSTCYNDNYYNIVTRRIRKIKNGCYTLTNHCHCQNNKDNDNNIDSNNNNNANNDNDDDDDNKNNNNNNNKMMINYNENEMNLVFQEDNNEYNDIINNNNQKDIMDELAWRSMKVNLEEANIRAFQRKIKSRPWKLPYDDAVSFFFDKIILISEWNNIWY